MTEQQAYVIKKIYQKDDYTFVIEWKDGLLKEYRLSDLQKKCPCAQCTDEQTGESIVDENRLDPNVKAIRVVNVGRYALRVEFTKGCSLGIYSYDSLR